MTADEMFEKLGYTQNDKIQGEIRYDTLGEKAKYKNGKEKKYYISGTDKRIVFYLEFNQVIAYSPTSQYDYEDCSVLITMEELQAINKKCKELGWLGDE